MFVGWYKNNSSIQASVSKKILYDNYKAKQSQFVVSQAIILNSKRIEAFDKINDNYIHRILIENTPLTSSISGSA